MLKWTILNPHTTNLHNLKLGIIDRSKYKVSSVQRTVLRKKML